MQPEPWTTYKDIKTRYWVVIDIDYWGLHETRQNSIQRVVMYQVGTLSKIERIPIGVFLNMVETKNMELYKI